MITRKAKYALHALVHLARQKDGIPVRISDLAKAEGIPQKFLERILLDLKRDGFLRSQMGQGGGYSLRMPAEAIAVGEILRRMDGPLAPVPCVSQTAYARCADCHDEATCGIRQVMKRARDAIADVLDHTSLADLRDHAERAALLLAAPAVYEI